tara:strand:+ start:3552 stop:4568 length:1017 start_codon:yes stop_codon:yes gene_type:complete
MEIQLCEFYKKDKNTMFELIKSEYHKNNYDTVSAYSSIYLRLFSKIQDEMCSDVYFFTGIATKSTDNIQALILLETAASMGTCQFKEEIGTHLPQEETIPSLIHFIYFKEKEFQKHHYACIKSASVHMPTFDIIVHNDEEPTDNVWWEMVKLAQNVKVQYYKRPKCFDGFQIEHVQYSADIARLEILFLYGGVYLDTDMLILKDFSSILNKGRIIFSTESGTHDYINSILISVPCNMFIMHMLNAFKSFLRITDCWATHIREGVGTLLTIENIQRYRIEILDHTLFYGFRWLDTFKFNEIEKYIQIEMFGIHLFDTIHHSVLVDNPYLNKLCAEYTTK